MCYFGQYEHDRLFVASHPFHVAMDRVRWIRPFLPSVTAFFHLHNSCWLGRFWRVIPIEKALRGKTTESFIFGVCISYLRKEGGDYLDMRSGLLAFGVILLVVGGLLYMMGYNGVQEYQTTLGQIGRFLSQSRQQEYQIYMLMETVGGILVLIGFVLSIAGAIAGGTAISGKTSGRRLERKVVAKRGAKTVDCPICGCSLDITTRGKGICPDCKNVIEIFFEG
jgi:hypothetical protein